MTNNLRQIDALIAEHAMGWKWYVHHDAPGKFLAPIEGRRPWWDLADGDEHVCQSRGPDIPRYSTDPAASKQLRYRTRELVPFFRRFEVHLMADGTAVAMIEAGQTDVDEHYVATADGETEELATALAVLDFLGIEAPK